MPVASDIKIRANGQWISLRNQKLRADGAWKNFGKIRANGQWYEFGSNIIVTPIVPTAPLNWSQTISTNFRAVFNDLRTSTTNLGGGSTLSFPINVFAQQSGANYQIGRSYVKIPSTAFNFANLKSLSIEINAITATNNPVLYCVAYSGPEIWATRSLVWPLANLGAIVADVSIVGSKATITFNATGIAAINAASTHFTFCLVESHDYENIPPISVNHSLTGQLDTTSVIYTGY